MSLERLYNEVLTKFETAQESRQTERLVRALFDQFQKSGYWHKDWAEYCRWIQLCEADRSAEVDASWARRRAMTEDERAAEYRQSLGNLEWIAYLDEFGLCQHTRINRNDMVIHAFCLGYGEPGRSDDPTIYVIHRPGDEDDYRKVYVVHRKWLPDYRASEWTCEPIQVMFDEHCKADKLAY